MFVLNPLKALIGLALNLARPLPDGATWPLFTGFPFGPDRPWLLFFVLCQFGLNFCQTCLPLFFWMDPFICCFSVWILLYILFSFSFFLPFSCFTVIVRDWLFPWKPLVSRVTVLTPHCSESPSCLQTDSDCWPFFFFLLLCFFSVSSLS